MSDAPSTRDIEREAGRTGIAVQRLDPHGNPYTQGSMVAQWWDLSRAVRVLGWTIYFHLPRWLRPRPPQQEEPKWPSGR